MHWVGHSTPLRKTLYRLRHGLATWSTVLGHEAPLMSQVA